MEQETVLRLIYFAIHNLGRVPCSEQAVRDGANEEADLLRAR